MQLNEPAPDFELPEIRLPAPGALPPIAAPLQFSSVMPSPAFHKLATPLISVPM